ncbi:hypothetical protein [Streptomyces sp. PTY087I2]|nr:hypothetical protein [Streptomyces sp. PTY087I2]
MPSFERRGCFGRHASSKAPEADQLFATTKPVADRGAALKSDLATT